MSLIISVHAGEILGSRGNPTIGAEAGTAFGFVGRAVVPGGVSTGGREAPELRNGDPSRYGGKDVLQAVENVNNTLIDVALEMNATDQAIIGKTLIDADGTKNKSKYGANAILGVSLAVTYTAADYHGLPLCRYLGGTNAKTLPVLMTNVLNGGSHADFSADFQELMIIPIGAKSIREAIRMGTETFHTLKKVLKSKEQVTVVSDRDGFAPNLEDNEAPPKYIVKAIEAAGFRVDEGICIVMDIAASEFYSTGTRMYDSKKSGQGPKTTDEMIAWYDEPVEEYPIILVGDGLGECDWDGWKKLTERLGEKIQIIGDDLFATNPAILQEGIGKDIADPVLIEVGQTGTLTETSDTMELIEKHGYTAVISHRSGETEDAIITDAAVALNAGQIKTGSMSRADRIAKYNQSPRIEEELGGVALFQGKSTFYNIYRH